MCVSFLLPGKRREKKYFWLEYLALHRTAKPKTCNFKQNFSSPLLALLLHQFFQNNYYSTSCHVEEIKYLDLNFQLACHVVNVICLQYLIMSFDTLFKKIHLKSGKFYVVETWWGLFESFDD